MENHSFATFPVMVVDLRELGELSASALDRPLQRDGELTVAIVAERGVVIGAFQRWADGFAQLDAPGPRVRRTSGGPSLPVHAGSLYVQLALARPDALVPCDAGRVVNRYVRPLLKALSSSVAPAHYFGRDWVSVSHRPAAWVGFAHDAQSGRAAVEAIIGVDEPFDRTPRASYMGKVPASCRELRGGVTPEVVAKSIVDAFAQAFGETNIVGPSLVVRGVADIYRAERPTGEPPWLARLAEAEGPVAAGLDDDGLLRLGGEFMASRDAVRAVQWRRYDDASWPTREAFEQLVASAFGRPGVVLDGVRDVGSLAGVLHEASRLLETSAHRRT